MKDFEKRYLEAMTTLFTAKQIRKLFFSDDFGARMAFGDCLANLMGEDMLDVMKEVPSLKNQLASLIRTAVERADVLLAGEFNWEEVVPGAIAEVMKEGRWNLFPTNELEVVYTTNAIAHKGGFPLDPFNKWSRENEEIYLQMILLAFHRPSKESMN